MATTIRPLGDRVLAILLDADDKTAGGIIIPDSAKKKPQRAKVISVGSGARDDKGVRQPVDLKVGDIVLFTEWGGTKITLNGTEHIILKESDVLAVEA